MDFVDNIESRWSLHCNGSGRRSQQNLQHNPTISCSGDLSSDISKDFEGSQSFGKTRCGITLCSLWKTGLRKKNRIRIFQINQIKKLIA